MLFVGIFIKKSYIFSVSTLTIFLSCFLKECNIDFFSDKILFIISTFLLSSCDSIFFCSVLVCRLSINITCRFLWLEGSGFGFSVGSVSVTVLVFCWHISFTYGRAKAGRPARTYIQQLCEDTGCSPEDLPDAVNDREKWRERVRDIRACGTTWWWWWFVRAFPIFQGQKTKLSLLFPNLVSESLACCLTFSDFSPDFY